MENASEVRDKGPLGQSTNALRTPMCCKQECHDKRHTHPREYPTIRRLIGAINDPDTKDSL